MKSITINMNDQGQIEVTPQDCNLEDMMNMLPLASLAIMRSATNQSPELKEFLYEVYNTSASNVLDRFDPTAIPNHDMTVEQMLQKENELINQAFANANRQTKRKYKRK